MRTHSDGDIGDYFKYGLLRTLAYSGLTLGINAYHMPDDAKKETVHGRHTRYLGNPRKYRHCDPELFETLKALQRKDEKKDCFIQRIAQSYLFPANTVFYTDPLNFQDMPLGYREQHRQGWFAYGLAQLQDCDLIFLDPVHGLEVRSTNPYRAINGPSYIALDEIKPFLDRQQSVVIHQHVARKSVADTITDFTEKIRNATGYKDSIESIQFKAGSPHLIFILSAYQHRVHIEETLSIYKTSSWKDFMTNGISSTLTFSLY